MLDWNVYRRQLVLGVSLIRALIVCWHSKLYLDKVTCLGPQR